MGASSIPTRRGGLAILKGGAKSSHALMIDTVVWAPFHNSAYISGTI